MNESSPPPITVQDAMKGVALNLFAFAIDAFIKSFRDRASNSSAGNFAEIGYGLGADLLTAERQVLLSDAAQALQASSPHA